MIIKNNSFLKPPMPPIKIGNRLKLKNKVAVK